MEINPLIIKITKSCPQAMLGLISRSIFSKNCLYRLMFIIQSLSIFKAGPTDTWNLQKLLGIVQKVKLRFNFGHNLVEC